MKESYWKRGSKEDARRISQAFADVGAKCTYSYFGRSELLYVFDGEADRLFSISYDSTTAHAIMDSHMFNELTLKVEPKFEVGDWVVFNNSHNSIYHISEIRDSDYMLTHTHGGSMPLSFSQGELLRPWTIDDAKDGDVLVDEYTDTIGIFEETNGIYWHSKIYCAKSTYTKVYHHGGSHHIKLTKPATKEQRELLFNKMKEVGYQWDADKKELRKIIKPKFEVGDLVVLDDLLGRITQSKYEDGMWLYCVGCRNTWNSDYELMKADHRAENRILKGGEK